MIGTCSQATKHVEGDTAVGNVRDLDKCVAKFCPPNGFGDAGEKERCVFYLSSSQKHKTIALGTSSKCSRWRSDPEPHLHSMSLVNIPAEVGTQRRSKASWWRWPRYRCPPPGYSSRTFACRGPTPHGSVFGRPTRTPKATRKHAGD